MNQKPSGNPTAWLQSCLRGHATGGVEVPCGDCTACCRGPRVIVGINEKDDYRCEEIGDSRGKGQIWALEQHADGRCTYLDSSGRCEIYDHRPLPCRLYDCRLLLHCGILPPQGPLRDAVLAWSAPRYGRREDYEVALALRTESARLLRSGQCSSAEDAAELAVVRIVEVLGRVKTDLARLSPAEREQAFDWVRKTDAALESARCARVRSGKTKD